jgi:predicted small lipoprotein YifL
MIRPSVKAAFLVAGIGLALSLPACGKKAPLRLADDRAAERAPTLRARMREGRVTLDFRVPAHRFFPEREDPWVLARILRQATPASEAVEAGAILKSGGFAFDSPLSWSDQVLPPNSAFVYRVEFRDAVRRRRALSEPLAVAWDQLPDAPSSLTAASHLRSIVLTWTAPSGAGAGVGYRIYRRETAQDAFDLISPDPVADRSFVDSRIESGRDYCYVVRAVLNAKALEVESPASPESCSRAAAEEPPQAP